MATKYANQNGAGAHDGSSEANSWSAAEYAAATIAANTTIALSGTITLNFSSKVDGTYFFFLPGCIFSSPMWPNATGAITITHNNCTVDGGGVMVLSGNSWEVVPNGIIENTANGSGLAHSAPSRGIQAINANGLVVKNLWVRNIYVRTDDTDVNDDDSSCISNKAANAEVIIGYTVFNCRVDNAYRGIEGDYGVGCSDYRFSYITATRCNWGIGVGDRGAGKTLNRISCDHIAVSDWTNWNNPGPNAYHHNGIFIFSNHDDAIVDGISITDCIFGPGFGNEFQTAAIYMNTGIKNPLVANCLFVAAPGESCGNGFVTMSSTSATTFTVANNTFIGGGAGTCIQLAGSGNGNAVTMNMKNNCGVGNGGGTYIALYANSNVTLNADYNWGFGFTASLAYSDSTNGSGNFKTFAQWQGLGFDLNGGNTDPDLSDNYSPNSGSDLIAAGANLTPIFDTDILNRIRPTPATPWCIGAFEGPWLPDALTLNQTANASPVTELYQRCPLGATVPADEVIHHAGNYPRQPDEDYVYAKSGTPQKHAYVFPGTLTLGQAQAARAAL